MTLRERTAQLPEAPHASGGGGGNLDQLRQQGENFWAAGDDAISRALSGNSEAFLAATRQEGGQ